LAIFSIRTSYSWMRSFSDSISLSSGSRTSRNSACNPAPSHLWAHFQPLLASELVLDIPKESIAKVTAPVLTIHGRKGRNAPYGGGREWDMLLPNARLITIDAAAQYILG
jgi:pimeloyl-ACP methyl ester carboxylesterase